MKFPFPNSFYPTGVATPDGAEHYVWEEKTSQKVNDVPIVYAVFYSRFNKAETKWTDKLQLSDEPYGERPYIFYNEVKGKLVVLYQSRDPTTKVVTNYRRASSDGGKTWK